MRQRKRSGIGIGVGLEDNALSGVFTFLTDPSEVFLGGGQFETIRKNQRKTVVLFDMAAQVNVFAFLEHALDAFVLFFVDVVPHERFVAVEKRVELTAVGDLEPEYDLRQGPAVGVHLDHGFLFENGVYFYADDVAVVHEHRVVAEGFGLDVGQCEAGLSLVKQRLRFHEKMLQAVAEQAFVVRLGAYDDDFAGLAAGAGQALRFLFLAVGFGRFAVPVLRRSRVFGNGLSLLRAAGCRPQEQCAGQARRCEVVA